MFTYLNRIRDILDAIESEESESINHSVTMIQNAIESQHSLFIFGASHAGILSHEMYYRAGGLMLFNPIMGRELSLDNEPITTTSHMERLKGYGDILANKTPFKKGDVLVVHSVSGRNTVALDLVLNAQQKGVQTICITNTKYSQSVKSRHESGKRLFEICDIVIDNHGDIGDAAISLEGIDQKVGATSTVIGATILNIIITELAQKLALTSSEIPYFYSANLDGGDSKNHQLYESYKENIHYRFK